MDDEAKIVIVKDADEPKEVTPLNFFAANAAPVSTEYVKDFRPGVTYLKEPEPNVVTEIHDPHVSPIPEPKQSPLAQRTSKGSPPSTT